MKQKDRKILLVDLDDTLEDFCPAWINKLNEKYGGNYSLDDVKDWEISNIYPNLTKEEKLSVLYEPGFWDTVKPKEGAQHYLKLLQDERYDIFIVTATDYRTVKEKVEKVIDKYFPFINHDHIVISFHKYLLNGDVLIDDNVNNLKDGNYIKILFTAPHNKSYEAVWPYTYIYRVNSWEECYQLIKKFE